MRSSIRYPTALEGVLSISGKQHVVTIADISIGGAKIRCPSPLPLRARLTLEVGEHRIDATIVWCSQTGYGLRFVRAVAPLEIVRQNHPALRRIYCDEGGHPGNWRRGSDRRDSGSQGHANLRIGNFAGSDRVPPTPTIIVELVPESVVIQRIVDP